MDVCMYTCVCVCVFVCAVCYPGSVCRVIMSPSLGLNASQFFMQLLNPSATAVLYSVGVVNRNDTGVITPNG